MSSPSTLTFPDAATITQFLRNHPLLNLDSFQKKGITKAIVEIAAERLANRQLEEVGVKQEANRLIHDLLKGKDDPTGKAIPDLSQLGLPPMIWTQITISTGQALLDCANSVKA